jgi:hypothetical protein
MGAVDSIPHLAAPAPKSERIERSWSARYLKKQRRILRRSRCEIRLIREQRAYERIGYEGFIDHPVGGM